MSITPQGQSNPETAPFAHSAVEPDFAPLLLYDGLGNRKTKTASRAALLVLRTGLREPPENVRTEVGRNTGPTIFNREQYSVILLMAANNHLSTCR
jgi:hypothetical protein